MLTAEATISTERAARYIDQFCQHAQQVHRMGHRPRGQHAGDGHPPAAAPVNVQRSDTRATLDFGWGRCILQAGTGILVLRAEAADEQSLRRVQAIITADIGRFGRRDHLAVTWQRPRTPTVRPGGNS